MDKMKKAATVAALAVGTTMAGAGPAFAQSPEPIADQIGDTIALEVGKAGLVAGLVIGACALVAFPIKAGWVAWRAGSKGVGKTGT